MMRNGSCCISRRFPKASLAGSNCSQRAEPIALEKLVPYNISMISPIFGGNALNDHVRHAQQEYLFTALGAGEQFRPSMFHPSTLRHGAQCCLHAARHAVVLLLEPAAQNSRPVRTTQSRLRRACLDPRDVLLSEDVCMFVYCDGGLPVSTLSEDPLAVQNCSVQLI